MNMNPDQENSLMKSLDTMFTGAQQTLYTGQKVLGAINEGITNFQNATDSRRVSAFPPQQSIMANQQPQMYYGYQQPQQQQQMYQPIQYGYGFDQNNGMYMSQTFGGYSNGMDIYGNQQAIAQGYAGFTNPNYGMTGGTNGFGGGY